MSKEIQYNRNRIKIIGIRILLPYQKYKFYLSIRVNDTPPIKTNTLEFNKDNKCILSQFYDLDPSVKKFKSIVFELYDEKFQSNFLYQGKCETLQKNIDDDKYNCYLKNSNGEDFAIVYFNFEFYQEDLFQSFNENRDNFIKQTNLYFSHRKSYSSSKKIENLNETGIYNSFIQNLDYLKLFLIYSEKIIKWENTWKTLTFLFLFTLIIYKFKFFFVFVFPLSCIFCHLKYKEKIKNYLIIKSPNFNKVENSELLYNIFNYFNHLVNIYENFTHKIMSGNKLFIEELYKSMIKLIIFNFILFYSRILSLVNFKFIFILCIWIYFLRKNPTFHSFEKFIISLINSKISPKLKSKRLKKLYSYINDIITTCLPFLKLKQFFNIEKDSPIIFENSNISQTVILDNKNNQLNLIKEDSQKINNPPKTHRQNSIPKYIKYELYENERWWMLVGWKKSMIMNEVPLWCKVNDLKTFCDKNMIFLPIDGINKYKWSSEWKVEINDNTDSEGWEYSTDFHSKFDKNDEGKFVRRRKWIRYATQIE